MEYLENSVTVRDYINQTLSSNKDAIEVLKPLSVEIGRTIGNEPLLPFQITLITVHSTGLCNLLSLVKLANVQFCYFFEVANKLSS